MLVGGDISAGVAVRLGGDDPDHLELRAERVRQVGGGVDRGARLVGVVEGDADPRRIGSSACAR